MNRSIVVSNEYSLSDVDPTKKSILRKEYSTLTDSETVKGDYVDSFDRVLPTELNIFSELPNDVYNNEDASLFLDALKRSIFLLEPTSIRGITLSKLRVTEYSEKSLVLEWIFNYFRLFFSFNDMEGDSFGTVICNPETGEFYNDMRPMSPDMFNDIAEAELAYVIMMVQG